MDKILEALKKLLPEESVKEVASAVDEMLTEAKKELEAEFNTKLEEAYAELSGELKAAEKTAEKGYQEAYAIINDLRNRLEVQREEFETTLEEGFEEAYQMILSERAKNSSIEVDIYDEYDNKLNEMKDYIVEKIDQFLQFKGTEIYEQAKRDVLNDPRMAEHKVALDKIVEIAAGYLSDEDYAFATSTKLADAEKKLEEMTAQIKMMEARNINLSRQNTKLSESVRHHQELVTESRQSEKKERAQKATKVSGRGKLVEDDQTKVISEHHNGPRNNVADQEEDTTTNLFESMGLDRETANLLAGTKKQS
jgi:hypothetical protein